MGETGCWSLIGKKIINNLRSKNYFAIVVCGVWYELWETILPAQVSAVGFLFTWILLCKFKGKWKFCLQSFIKNIYVSGTSVIGW